MTFRNGVGLVQVYSSHYEDIGTKWLHYRLVSRCMHTNILGLEDKDVLDPSCS